MVDPMVSRTLGQPRVWLEGRWRRLRVKGRDWSRSGPEHDRHEQDTKPLSGPEVRLGNGAYSRQTPHTLLQLCMSRAVSSARGDDGTQSGWGFGKGRM